MTTPQDRLAEIEARVKAATLGPWYPCGARFSIVSSDLNAQEILDICDTAIAGLISCEQAEANGRFIAASRDDVPFLLQLVRELQEALEDICVLHENESTNTTCCTMAEWAHEALAKIGGERDE